MADEKIKLEDLLGKKKSQKIGSGKIEHVAIIGAGVMGQGIAQTIASAGLDVFILEKDEAHLQSAQNKLSESMNHEINRWAMTQSDKNSILSRLTWGTDFKDIEHCDLIIEAVDENLTLKKSVFKKIDEMARPEAIIASNTSTLSLSEIASVTRNPERIIGLHFLNPVPKALLVELIRGLKTSDQTLRTVHSFASRLGKTAVEVYEYPGYVTTRAIVPLLNEAMHILMEGVATAQSIDTAMRLGYNFPMGPLEMADTMGLDEVLTWMESLWKTLGESRYRACPILRKLVREQKLGKKTGEGFFRYDKEGKIIL